MLLITKCMRAEIKRDEKLLIDLEGPNFKRRDLYENSLLIHSKYMAPSKVMKILLHETF